MLSDSSADPLLDEHFRRSLGADYQNLFTKNEKTSSTVDESSSSSNESSLPASEAKDQGKDNIIKAFQEDMEMEGYTGERQSDLNHELKLNLVHLSFVTLISWPNFQY